MVYRLGEGYMLFYVLGSSEYVRYKFISNV